MVGATGLEPATLDPQSSALPGCATPRPAEKACFVYGFGFQDASGKCSRRNKNGTSSAAGWLLRAILRKFRATIIGRIFVCPPINDLAAPRRRLPCPAAGQPLSN